MNFFEKALPLRDKGFFPFPVVAGTKRPDIEDFANNATRDIEKLRKWSTCEITGWEQPREVGIVCAKFERDGEIWHLLVVDIDDKKGKRGSDEVMRLELEGKEFSPTYTQFTPSGGKHYVYRTKIRFSNSASRIAPGIDIRGVGGYIVGSGSEIDDKAYTDNGQDVEEAPLWLEESCRVQEKTSSRGSVEIDQPAARARAIEFLHRAPASVEGSGGNDNAFAVAARVRDFGVDSAADCLEIMLSSWNERCAPPWGPDELGAVVEHAYAYARDEIGCQAPETVFEKIGSGDAQDDSRSEEASELGAQAPVQGGDSAGARALSPTEKLNKEYAFVVEDGGHHILWETTDAKGRFELKRLPEITFHHHNASKTNCPADGKAEQITKTWLRSEKRRTYRGYCFRPGLPETPGYYNLFRGFAVQPLAAGEEPTPAAAKSVQDFLDHALQNICDGDVKLFEWLIGYFAHLFQKPWEKPLVALVFKGKKGVGKNALIDRVGYLLGNHSLVTADSRYLLSNFNAHIENLLLFTLDEAFWSGDKKAEGVLKNLITGNTHVIERKGAETYTVENRTRIVIIGNEEWLVPATQDERRFAVFTVGDGRIQDRSFFQSMREEMERGGYRWLLRYLLDYDLRGIDVNAAPKTQGLLEQKLSSDHLVHKWWRECLSDGHIVDGNSGTEEWPDEMAKETIRSAVERFAQRNSRGWPPESRIVFKKLKECAPALDNKIKITRADGTRVNGYKIPPLEQARKQWEEFCGQEVQW